MTPGSQYSPYKKFLAVMVPMALIKYKGVSNGAKLSDGAKLAFGVLCYHGGKSGKFPDQKKLASEMGVHVDTLNGYIHELVAHGLIAVRRHGPGKPGTYDFLWTDFLAESLRDTAETPCHDTAETPYQRTADTAILLSRHGDLAVQDTVESPCHILIYKENVLREQKETYKPATVPPVADVAEGEKRTSPKHSEAPPKLPKHQSPSFDEFWMHYWRKTDKPNAIRAFNKHAHTEAKAKLIIAAVIAHAPQYLARETEHRPYAATWLNKQRYLEPPEVLEGKVPLVKGLVYEDLEVQEARMRAEQEAVREKERAERAD